MRTSFPRLAVFPILALALLGSATSVRVSAQTVVSTETTGGVYTRTGMNYEVTVTKYSDGRIEKVVTTWVESSN